MEQTNEVRLCRDAHRVDGIIPQEFNIEFDGRSCECGKILFYAEACGCPSSKDGKKLKSNPNPNYKGQ